MFSSTSSLETNGVNAAGDVASRWRGIFVTSLRTVLHQVHPTLTATENALLHVEGLILRLLEMLCAKPSPPHTITDVEERVQRSFPNPIDRWALTDANQAIEKGRKKSSLVLPVEKVHVLLQKEVLQYKIDYIVAVYIVAVLEYISADILKLAGKYVKNINHVEITDEDIDIAMCADKVLMDLFYQDGVVGGSFSIPEERALDLASTYDEVVKDLIAREKQYRRELHMIIKVFREQMTSVHPVPADLDLIFSNIADIEEVTLNLLSSLEDSLEMTEDNQNFAVGSCFLEFAEVEEFAVYEKYAKGVLSPEARETLQDLLSKDEVCLALKSAGHGFKEAVKYVLPKLLLSPIYHCLEYLDYIRAMLRLSESEDDRESLEEACALLKPLETELERVIALNNLPARGVKKFGDAALYYSHRRTSRQDTLKKLSELQKTIDGWEVKDTGQSCNEFILEGVLKKLGARKQVTERYVFLFDGLMILCKHNVRRTSVTGGSTEFRMKEKFYLRKVEIIDRENTEELKHALEIAPRLQPSTVLITNSTEEKSMWMAALIRLNTKSMLERILDTLLLDEDKQHPLTFPPIEKYRFSEEDSPKNIIETPNGKGGVPIIKGATLSKLIERLTYHLYADPNFAKVFLTTYRSFCTPHQLLDLLIERFDIPEYPFTGPTEPGVTPELSAVDREKAKRFRNEYVKPVQFRVLNVIRQWVDRHYYDFRRDTALLEKLHVFLDRIRGKSMRKWLDSIHKIIKRREEPGEEQREITYGDKVLPPFEHHLPCSDEDYQHLPLALLQLHPIELARQITLLEFELYRAVQPSELVGSLWTKKDKHLTSPNLLKMIHHTDNVTRWMQKCIVDTENMEERVAVVCRILEVMIVLQELNNFNGVLEVVSAIDSASVHRLQFTFQNVPPNRLRALDEARDLSKDHLKKYVEKLRSVNPPCVPFFGMYLTNILYIEGGNPDFLVSDGAEIINFNKRRKVAEITGEIQQFQNQPYCLTVEPRIRNFLVNLKPFGDKCDREISDLLYNKSLEIEPRNIDKPPKFPRRWPHLSLKSPGIKPRHYQKNAPYPLSLGDRIFSSSRSLIGGDSVDEVEPHTAHSPMTPPSPNSSTPSTPPPDSTVFALVQFGGPSASGPGLPPPLPPRSARKQRDALDRRNEGSPPPLPPRRISAPLDGGKPPPGPATRSNTAPLYNGLAGTPPTPTSSFPKAPMPLPSTYSDHQVPHGTFIYPPPGGYHVPQPPPPLPMQPPPPMRSQSHHMAMSSSAVGPELPPKTYRQTQSKHDSGQGPLHSPGYHGPKRM